MEKVPLLMDPTGPEEWIHFVHDLFENEAT